MVWLIYGAVLTCFFLSKMDSALNGGWVEFLTIALFCLGIMMFSLWRLTKKTRLMDHSLSAGIHIDHGWGLVHFVKLNAKSRKRLTFFFYAPALMFISIFMLFFSFKTGSEVLEDFLALFSIVSSLQFMSGRYCLAESDHLVINATSGDVLRENVVFKKRTALGLLKEIEIRNISIDGPSNYAAVLKGEKGEFIVPPFCISTKTLKKSMDSVAKFLKIPIIMIT